MPKKFKRLCLLFNSLCFLFLSSQITFTSANTLEEQECDIVVEHGLCLYNGDKLLFADAQPEGLIGHWTFDDYRGLDSSGNHNHANSALKPGPGMGGIGYSAEVGGENYITIPYSESFKSSVWSSTFWVFLYQASSETVQETHFCPLFVKGNEDEDRTENFEGQAILFDQKERSLRVSVATTASETDGETLDSKARIPLNRWTHVAVVRLEKKIRLYVNGILDSVVSTVGTSLTGEAPLYIGGSPFVSNCSYSAYIDEMRYYTRELNEEEIEAEASPALGNLNPNFVKLGCVNCSLKQASEGCVEGYHLCSTIELHSGVYQVARNLGWTSWNSRIWSYSATKLNGEAVEGTGLGICCLD